MTDYIIAASSADGATIKKFYSKKAAFCDFIKTKRGFLFGGIRCLTLRKITEKNSILHKKTILKLEK